MTVRQAVAGEVFDRMAAYRIQFGNGDETELDAENVEDLEEVWDGFCRENDIDPFSVTYAERVYDPYLEGGAA